MSSFMPKKPFDTTTLENTITITIQFDNANSIFGGSGVYPSGFQNASVLYRTGDLSSKNLSLAGPLRNDPSLRLAYPFQYAQSYTSQSFQGMATIGQPVNICVNNFINSDLTSSIFSVVLNDNLIPPTGSNPSTFNYAPITNIQIQMNGQIIYNAPYELYKLYNMQGSFGSSYFWNSVINPGTVAPFTSEPVDTYVVIIDWSRLRANMYNSVTQNCWRIAANTMTFSFNTPDTSTYTMFLTNFYNAVAEIGNGGTRIYLS